MANLTKIASEYDMVSIMQTIATNYFGGDLSTQRVGMFGYLTESMAHMFGASVLDSSIRSNEYNVATAQRLETLLYEASTLGLDVSNAIPTTMTVYLGIKTSSIINPSQSGGYATREPNKDHPDQKYDTCTLVLEKDAIITIANYQFTFEHDIQIKAVWSDTANRYVYSVKYLTEGDKDITSTTTVGDSEYVYPKANTLTELSNTYIPSYVTSKNGLTLLLFKVNLKQMRKTTHYHSVIKNDIISLTGLDFLYDDMLSHFNVYYRPNNRSEWFYVKPVSIYDRTKYKEDIVHYEVLHEESKLRLTMDDFIPEYNSEFKIDIYSTLGNVTNGLVYRGDGSDISVELVSIDERHSDAGLDIACLPINTWSDGRNIPTLEELRDRIIRRKATLDSLDTEYDLYNFIKEKDSINDYVFIKKRNDTKERRFSAFTIPRMTAGDIIPSSTMNICIPLANN